MVYASLVFPAFLLLCIQTISLWLKANSDILKCYFLKYQNVGFGIKICFI